MRFKTDDNFNSSHKIGSVAGVNTNYLTDKLGTPSDYDVDGKVDVEWNGEFTAKDGTTHRANV